MQTTKKMKEKKTTARRNRRTKVEIEKSLFDAATKIIEKSGFQGLTVTGIAQQAKIEPPVFYNRYKDLNDFIDIYVRDYDFWLRDSLEVNLSGNNPVEVLTRLFDGVIDSLANNVPMQKLIAWEMNERNFVTKRTSQARDINAIKVIDYFLDALKNSSVKSDYAIALILGGIYYLVIHRDLGTFNYIDFTKQESIEKLKENLHIITRKIFDDYKTPARDTSKAEDKQTIQIARELLKSNVSYEVVQKATKLNDEVLKSLYEAVS